MKTERNSKIKQQSISHSSNTQGKPSLAPIAVQKKNELELKVEQPFIVIKTITKYFTKSAGRKIILKTKLKLDIRKKNSAAR